MWCNHEWKEITRTYASSIFEKGIDVQMQGGNDIDKHGQTTILWECKKCHELRKEEMLGKIMEKNVKF